MAKELVGTQNIFRADQTFLQDKQQEAVVSNWRRGRKTNNGQRKITEEAKGDLN